MTQYTITSGTPSHDELIALEEALKHHRESRLTKKIVMSSWGKPQLRKPLARKT